MEDQERAQVGGSNVKKNVILCLRLRYSIKNQNMQHIAPTIFLATLNYILKPNLTRKTQWTKHTQLSVHTNNFNVRYTQIKLS
ncbi:hypothetical protein VCRA2116O30_90193 [Vibrio crassostreae]|nr:hypothetical protein VCRA2117O37_100184 [Vibrio crassostreae]CAK1712679.1 hypothetical protein VCRA2116O31_100192 [Vibrio crassostreae]CAK2224965.1 hypothetical protein VCRA2119O46_70054 [Vibrio crassostreae]CAK2225487.1 hypothetical protein VCRA2116O28_70053 [Vibrio crassostreae]CAK2225754.1 hypothetical protein VCRA2119O44_70054 [Vibrio crassostreae]